MTNFDFISTENEYIAIHNACVLAENAKAPVDIAINCRAALWEIIKLIYKKHNVKMLENATLLELIDNKTVIDFVNNSELIESVHFIRKLGMNAEHDKNIKKKYALLALSNLELFCRFVYIKFEKPTETTEFVMPAYISEAETRRIYIDSYLSEVGWEVIKPNSVTVLPDGTEVTSGIVMPDKACCEIPVKDMPNASGVGFCDYVLYGKDGKPLAIIEAKKTSVEALVAVEQVKTYGECMKKQYGYVPVLYYTNGYEIYIIDGLYPSRRVMAFHTAEELQYMLQKRERKDITDLQIRDDISGRPYQKMAITNICERFNNLHRRGLIVMATGTGKTRVSISLVEILARNKWIKNVLFLADRTSLVQQAFKNFQKILKDTSYCVLSDKKLANEPNARITFSTHQTMINYIDAENKEFSSAHFDLIIVDEAHRSVFNKYGSIFNYFDCLLVGLTATPKDEVDANTYQLFNCENGEPNFSYSLEEGVKDHYLVPYKVESRTTKLLSQGVKYSDLTKEDKDKVESVFVDEVEPDFVIPKETLFKIFYNIDTCERVLDELMNMGLKVDYGQKIGKTIIFAYNHKHAALIVDVFKKLYPQYGEDYCQLIDNQVKGASELINKFETDDNFRIAVSVDMLDTGIDVPSVLNLVFFKPVKSKIKFVQMIGRGTRLCEGLIDGKDKDHFLIFDYCGNFEYFNLNVDGAENVNSKSITQRLFDLKLNLLVELQKIEHQNDTEHKAYYDKLKPELFNKVCEIKKNSSRISVRSEMAYVDKYCDEERWQAISILDAKEMELHISKLIDSDINEDKKALAFDVKMFNIELSVLANGSINEAIQSVGQVRKAARILLDHSTTEGVKEKAETLQILAGTEFWENIPKVSNLEKYREEIRDLMKYISSKIDPINIDTPDEVMPGNFKGETLMDIRTYKEKVVDYLAKNTDNPTILKIRNLEPINSDDLKELERILWEELGTKEEYEKATDIDNLAAFIRSIVGIAQDVINEKFGKFLNDNVLNSQQQEFIKAIIDYVRENGDIEKKDLLEKSPFDNYDFLTLFKSNIPILIEIVNIMHNSITAA